MNKEKSDFLRTEFIPLLKNLSADAKGKWGVMNGQQMAEHVTAFFKVSTEKIKFPLVTPVEHLPKYKEFLWSDKQFRENTKAPANIVGETPLPTHYATMEEAVNKLQKETDAFFEYFKNNPDKKTLHPVFGELNFEEWVQLHHKHVTHHLRQFGLL
jgi:oxepin-CoA hydrolase/3-oxo-5,6-dehydrosuberyl-CoA semialdehyde dehydrogenase